MDTITAEAARQLTAKSLQELAIEPFVSKLSQKIRATASEGKSYLDPWLYLVSIRLQPSPEQQEAIKVHFIKAGFQWKDHPNPDPGHPASRAYTTLSW